MTLLYSTLHMLVDGVCALTMFGLFLSREDGYFQILVYNFCAFALQMPFGVLLDRWYAGGKACRQADPACLTAAAGVLCTMAGAFTHPAVLGIGNALFHVGGGVGCIREDNRKARQGRDLGIFVAPGALGLYLGTLAAKQGMWKAGYLGAGVLLIILCAWAMRAAGYQGKKKSAEADRQSGSSKLTAVHTGAFGAGAAACCLAVVVLRSYVGMAVSFPWKTGAAAGCLAVLAVAGGKAAGGFAAAKYGGVKTAVASLAAAAGCYLFSGSMPVGLAALFLFNMTMPVTLYWMVRSMPEMPGLAFGFLTFALFLGFLPVYFGLAPTAGGKAAGCAGSIVSLLLLVCLMRVPSRRS